MSQYSPRLNLPFIQQAQAQKHVTHNEAIERLDLLVQLVVEAFGANTPPVLAAEGQIWAVGAVPTGAWAGQANKLAAWAGGGWLFMAPAEGWLATSAGELRLWNGTAWVAPLSVDMQNLPGVGVNTSHDGTNRLAVSASATLLTHDGAGHQLKINKSAAGDTASLLFQTGWSGRAEMGTAGDDDFSVKVSADGGNWHTGLTFDSSSGNAVMQQVQATALTGTAVTQSSTDTTAGRLITTGAGPAQAFRRGNILGVVSQSGGVPTGALIESDSNDDGFFVRYADGTQICWAVVTLVYQAAEELTKTVSFPAAFFSGNRILTATFRGGVQGAGIEGRPLRERPNNISPTGSRLQVFGSGFTESSTLQMSVNVVGRWSA